jgi:aspartate-semialdehyde dehydrogenase
LVKPRSAPRLKLALIGAETLLGKELEERLGNRPTAPAIVTFASTGEGNFSEEDGEAIYLEAFERRALEDVSAVLIAGVSEGAHKAYQLIKSAEKRPHLIDCTYHLENQPEGRLVAPIVNDQVSLDRWLLVLAHPAATALALILRRLQFHKKLRHIVALVFEPASEQGKRGVSELHHQTTNLLAFKPLEKKIFDAQLSFNLLARYGEEALASLTEVEQRIERHLATILSSDRTLAAIPMPSLRVVGVPVFHGYSLSLWVEFERDVNSQEIEEALASANIEVRSSGEDPPDAVAIAGQSGLFAGDIRIDRNNAHAAWIWITADNLRLSADSAATLIAQLEARPDD